MLRVMKESVFVVGYLLVDFDEIFWLNSIYGKEGRIESGDGLILVLI